MKIYTRSPVHYDSTSLVSDSIGLSIYFLLPIYYHQTQASQTETLGLVFRVRCNESRRLILIVLIWIGGAGVKVVLTSNTEQWNRKIKWNVSLCVCPYVPLFVRVSLYSHCIVLPYVRLSVGPFACSCVCLHVYLSISLSNRLHVCLSV